MQAVALYKNVDLQIIVKCVAIKEENFENFLRELLINDDEDDVAAAFQIVL